VFAFLKYAFLLSIVLGVLAIIFGLVGHSRGKKGLATNGRNALIGAMLGIIGVIAGITWTFVLVNSIKNDTDFGRYFSCVSEANGDQAAARQCADRYLHPTDLTTGSGS
jgi:uncharacterized protein (UPF0333 family)